MSDTLAEKINGLKLFDGCSVDMSLALGKQADLLTENDIVTLNRFGKEFPIPPKIKLKSHLSVVEFNTFLAEPLLREGSLLLDRCIQQRREHDELKTKFFEACIQIDELLRLNKITEEEEKDYFIPKDIAQSEKDALQAEKDSIAEQLKQLLQVIKCPVKKVFTAVSY